MKKYILGIDTSAYTTSLAVADIEGNIICDLRKVLTVPLGQKGLRQQEAVFQHIKNIGDLFENINIDFKQIATVSVSSAPRNVEGSYMPVFTVGQNYAKVISKSLSAEYTEYSHQENHIAAALVDDYETISKNILAVHMSGGTTEFLSVAKSPKGYAADIVGGTKDVTFGQLIDRIGTYMDFPFPCGLYMEKYMDEKKNTVSIKNHKVSGDSYINLSGMENHYKHLYDAKINTKEEIIKSLFEYIAECTVSIINSLEKEYCFETVILTGGVAANSCIRQIIDENLNKRYKLIFPIKGNSSDNALGNAYLPMIDRWYYEA